MAFFMMSTRNALRTLLGIAFRCRDAFKALLPVQFPCFPVVERELLFPVHFVWGDSFPSAARGDGRVMIDHPNGFCIRTPNITFGGATARYTERDWVLAIRHGVKPDGKPIEIRRNPDDLRSTIVGSEFCGTSITSEGDPQARCDKLRSKNRHLLLTDSRYRGYTVMELTRDQARANLRVIDSEKTRTSQVSTLASFVVAAGMPGPKKAG